VDFYGSHCSQPDLNDSSVPNSNGNDQSRCHCYGGPSRPGNAGNSIGLSLLIQKGPNRERIHGVGTRARAKDQRRNKTMTEDLF